MDVGLLVASRRGRAVIQSLLTQNRQPRICRSL